MGSINESPHRAGHDVFIDHLHPNLLGNERIAAIIADRFREVGLPVPATAWVDGGYQIGPGRAPASQSKIVKMEHFAVDLTRFFVEGRCTEGGRGHVDAKPVSILYRS